MTEMAHILVVDDDPAVRAMLSAYVKSGGYRVSEAGDATDAKALLTLGDIDLVLLDLNLPDANGMVLAREMMNRWGVGIVMVTERNSPEDRADGLELGADDYLPKPVFPRELLARLRKALDNRVARPAGGGSQQRWRFNGWSLDPLNRFLLDDQGEKVDLTPAEFDLLSILAGRPGRLQSREQLMSALGSDDGESGTRSVDILVSRLRKKLGDGDHGRMIETCRGHGYRFAAEVRRE
ncbi:MAG TPA: response regulator transcription factor [Candidatus Sulfotelmatobacter sp.]|nr:response regulator transcription factor [Candidatus Sulfotelmatobacter sp.]